MVDKTLAQKYRALARAHFDDAESLLDKGDDHLPFVCLRLWQCIEALSYGLLEGRRPVAFQRRAVPRLAALSVT
jgi:hypothetical protein